MAVVGGLRFGQRERVGSYTRAWVGNSIEFDYLVQAGGGGGQRYTGGGGGGGQVQSWEASAGLGVVVGDVGTVSITVGAGSTGAGGQSLITGVQQCSGGGNSNTNAAGSSGGCGGGRQYNYAPPGSGIAGPPRQGYDGGWGGGGTAAAANLSTNNGAAGRETNIRGTVEYFGGGGSGSGYATGVGGSSGGVGGGGNYNTAGGTNTGGGGGASLNDPPYSNAGGSGIVIVRIVESDLGVGRQMRRKVSGQSSTTYNLPYETYTFTGSGSLVWSK